ncbi:MAG: HNH endonuclease family protein [Candidatus Acidiferrales bacterium]
MRDLFREGEGFYSWAGLRYFLFEYEQHLKQQAGKCEANLNWLEFIRSRTDYETIEHIYPRSPLSSDWPTFEERSAEERLVLLNSLGNLLALSQSRNSKASNRSFEEEAG